MITKRSVFVLLIVFLFFTSLFSKAQNEASKWFFGNGAGLDFSTTPPTPLSVSSMSTYEGCASISNSSGALLFYTDGATVWNQTHAMMANGSTLFGHSSSTQSSIIVKQPGNTNLYYIFTSPQLANGVGICYSVVDMNLSAGMGSVTIKNSTLAPASCEKLTAIKHCNGIDFWILSHDYNSNTFRAHLLNASGVNSLPVLSSVGSSVTSEWNTAGQMKASPDGRKLGMAVYGGSMSAEVFDFDPSTGLLSNPITLLNSSSMYGCEFSPNSKLFYVSFLTFNNNVGQILQWDLTAGNSAAVIASCYSITSTSSLSVGSLQLAIDSKIYVACNNSQSIGIINYPNIIGANCAYNPQAVAVGTGSSTIGLPNFIGAFFKHTPFSYTVNNCQTASFSLPADFDPTLYSSVSWDFGDPSSGLSNTSLLLNPTHTFTGVGPFMVKLVLNNNTCSADTVKQTILLNTAIPLSVNAPSVICKGKNTVVTASGANSYTWSTGGNGTTRTLTPVTTTTYSVMGSLSTGSCIATRVFTITVTLCTDTEEFEKNDPILSVFPNPADDKITVNTYENSQIILYNSFGTVIFEQHCSLGKSEIDLLDVSAGIYYLHIKSQNSEKRIKLIKNR